MLFTPEKQARLRDWQGAHAAREQERANRALESTLAYAAHPHSRQGNRTNHPPRHGMRYWTKRRQRDLEQWEQRQAVLKARREAEAKEQRRLRANASARAYHARRKAAGFRNPKRSKPEKKGNSTIRMRRWRSKRRILLAAWDEAIREDRRRARRIEKGLRATPLTRAEKDAAYRVRKAEKQARKAAEKAVYLARQWWSPEITSEAEIRGLIHEQHPDLDEIRLHVECARLLTIAHGENLRVNTFVLADAQTDGVELACERRAIFYECYSAAEGGTSLPDICTILRQAEAIKSIKDVPSIAAHKDNPSWQANKILNSLDHARIFVSLQSIYEAEEKNNGSNH